VSAGGAIARMLLRVPTRTPFSMGYFYSTRLSSKIRDAARKNAFDLVFVHCSSVAQYVETLPIPHKILDFGDMDSQKWQVYAREKRWPLSLVYALEGWKLEAEERRLAAGFDLCTCTTRAELDTLDSYGTARRSDWFPNGVDHVYFQPLPEAYDPDLISFVGRMDYFPNQECVMRFCSETLPLVQAVRPSAKFVVIGAEPPANIRRLAELPGVSVTGSVDDVRSYLGRSAVNVAPLRIARGTQNKILEAMAMGVPVITSVEAARGVDAVHDEHLLVATGPREEAAAILGLLNDPVKRLQLGHAGMTRIRTHHSWSESLNRMDRIIESCVTESSSSRNATCA